MAGGPNPRGFRAPEPTCRSGPAEVLGAQILEDLNPRADLQEGMGWSLRDPNSSEILALATVRRTPRHSGRPRADLQEGMGRSLRDPKSSEILALAGDFPGDLWLGAQILEDFLTCRAPAHGPHYSCYLLQNEHIYIYFAPNPPQKFVEI